MAQGAGETDNQTARDSRGFAHHISGGTAVGNHGLVDDVSGGTAVDLQCLLVTGWTLTASDASHGGSGSDGSHGLSG